MSWQELWHRENQNKERAFGQLIVWTFVLIACSKFLPLIWLIPISFWGLLPVLRNSYQWYRYRQARLRTFDEWSDLFRVCFVASFGFGLIGLIIATWLTVGGS